LPSPDSRVTPSGVAWLAAVAAGYFLLAGVPLGPARTAALAAILVVAGVFRSAPMPRRIVVGAASAIALLLIVRLVSAAGAPSPGFAARYYANVTFSGTPQWSADFRQEQWTRIDGRISFKDDQLPAHYLNDPNFDHGIRREVTDPMSVEWRGYSVAADERPLHARLNARGSATVAVDEKTILTVSSPKSAAVADADLQLPRGPHAIVVRYIKPPDTDALIDVDLPIATTASPGSLRRAGWAERAATAIDAAVVIVWFLAAAPTIGRVWRPIDGIPLGLFAVFGLHGWWQARPLADRVVALTAGDDWFGFESSAREILHHGLLMTFGQPLGEGRSYFYHPLYGYFLAAVHGITGESLFGPVFVQFLILAAVAVLMWRLALELFGPTPAAAGVLALVAILELDFARYYTVTLLSENLYILTVTLTLVPFARWIRDGDRGNLWRAAFWGGVSSITRPSMMLFFVPALALVAFVAWARERSLRTAAGAAVAVAAIWLCVIAPISIRNLVVSGRFVLISEGLGATFIKYNVPEAVNVGAYESQYSGSTLSGLAVLTRIAWDHPAQMLATQGRKLGFSLGMVHWYGGYRMHPELVAVTLLYCATLCLSARLRARELWPVHLFVLTHLASMGLTMPWNYGYRLIIPPFVYTSTLSAAAAFVWVKAHV